MTKLEQLLHDMDSAYRQGVGYVVEVKSNSTPENEIIVNPNANLPAKMEYYKKAYDDGLKLKANNTITIVEFYQVVVEN